MKNLLYSGIMTNYACTASCRHCMFCSSPHAGKDFLTPEAGERICEMLSRSGVRSLHIGGGEPFMRMDVLTNLLSAMRGHGIETDYIETNAFWMTGEEEARRRLEAVRALGVNCIMVSIDPFHVEYVPLRKPIRLVRLLEDMGFDYFIWQEKFIKRLRVLPDDRPLTNAELKKALGAGYVETAAREYGLKVNGRALTLAHKLLPCRKASEVVSARPCTLLEGVHCHVDLYENVIPSGCPGIGIELGDYIHGKISPDKYPVAYRLLTGGTQALLAYAREKGFEEDKKGYITTCELCFAMRAWLRKNSPSQDIGPDCFYLSMEKAYGEEGLPLNTEVL